MFAVAFSAVLIALQVGLLVGWLEVSSAPIHQSRAHIWVAARNADSLGNSTPIPSVWRTRLSAQPEVDRVEEFIYGFGSWRRADGTLEQCYVIGSRLEEDSLGAPADFTPLLRQRLTRPGTVAGYAQELAMLGVSENDAVSELAGHRVEVVGIMKGRGAGLVPGVYGSLRTARALIPALQGEPQATPYLLARCRDPARREAVAARLRKQYPDMETMTREEFGRRARHYWLVKTRAGIALGFAAALGLLVGAVITSQTLYAAVAGSLREYAVLRALGIPRRRLMGLVLSQSLWVAAAGLTVALPIIFGLARLGAAVSVEARLPVWLLALTAAVTTGMALLSGLAALRSLRLAEPIALLR